MATEQPARGADVDRQELGKVGRSPAERFLALGGYRAWQRLSAVMVVVDQEMALAVSAGSADHA
jgi:hypothetical protein